VVAVGRVDIDSTGAAAGRCTVARERRGWAVEPVCDAGDGVDQSEALAEIAVVATAQSGGHGVCGDATRRIDDIR